MILEARICGRIEISSKNLEILKLSRELVIDIHKIPKLKTESLKEKELYNNLYEWLIISEKKLTSLCDQ